MGTSARRTRLNNFDVNNSPLVSSNVTTPSGHRGVGVGRRPGGDGADHLLGRRTGDLEVFGAAGPAPAAGRTLPRDARGEPGSAAPTLSIILPTRNEVGNVAPLVAGGNLNGSIVLPASTGQLQITVSTPRYIGLRVRR